METQARETFSDLGAFASAIGFVTVPPPSAHGDHRDRDEVSEFERAQGAVLDYLREHVLEGDASGVTDRIQSALLDDTYHRLTARAGATVPIMKIEEMLQAEDANNGVEVSLSVHVPEKLLARLQLALRIQERIVRAILAAMSKRPRSVGGRKRVTPPTAAEQLAFVYDPTVPAAIKEAALAAWIAPMCCSAIYASSASTDEATLEILLDQWIKSMRHHLALGVALKAIEPLPVEILPVEFQFESERTVERHIAGLERVVQKLEQMDQTSSTSSR